MNQLSKWLLIKNSLHAGMPVMLLYVLESAGSSPGRQGFCMAVTAGGDMEGSIGGGIMEHKFVEMARDQLKSVGFSQPDIRKQFHDKSAARNQSGMICSGEQSILLYLVKPSDLAAVQSLIQCIENFQHGTLSITTNGIHFDTTPPLKDFDYSYKSDSDWIYYEKIGYKQTLFIVGGGHCSLALSNLMRSLDFYISVYDDRPGLKTLQANRSAHEKHYLKDYSLINALIPGGDDVYVVIMTFGYRTDDVAVRALMNKDFKYLGLLGSKTKVEKMFAAYAEEGISPDRLQRIHSPIGLDIKSQSPEEIAVSIAAQIIEVKNKDL